MKDKLKNINLNTILIIVGIVFALLFLKQCNSTANLKDEVKIANMNQIALLDSIRVERDKSGSLVFQTSTLIASEKELKTLNSELYAEVKELKGKTKVIIHTVTEIVHDTVFAETIIYQIDSNTYRMKWAYDTTFSVGNFQRLAGTTTFDFENGIITNPFTTIDENTFSMSLVTGLKEGKDTYEIFVKSDYPGFSVTNMQGSILDKKMVTSNESSWVVGPNIGYGITFNPNGQISHGFIVGAGVTYNLNKPIKKLFRPFGL